MRIEIDEVTTIEELKKVLLATTEIMTEDVKKITITIDYDRKGDQ